jgi:hypothetical protein
VQQKFFTVKDYCKSGNSVVRVLKKFYTEFALCKGPTENSKVMLDAHPCTHLMWWMKTDKHY